MVDLSTGINPNGWPVPELPGDVWQRLPEESPALQQAAVDYYGVESLLAVAGTQAAIQLLPRLRPQGRVGVLQPTYSEHPLAWVSAGHQVVALDHEEIEKRLPELDVLVLVNPNNPTAVRFERDRLLSWHRQLAARGGWLVVDEAFVDTTPDQSLLVGGNLPDGLIVLRSLGKFFGLAGIRVGFVAAEPMLLRKMEALLGPWSVSHPAQWIAERALRDPHWQQQTRMQLGQQSDRLKQLLNRYRLPPTAGTALFQWAVCEQAPLIMEQLAREGILVRLFEQPASLRFGLPADETQWQKLEQALQKCEGEIQSHNQIR